MPFMHNILASDSLLIIITAQVKGLSRLSPSYLKRPTRTEMSDEKSSLHDRLEGFDLD